MCVWCVCVWAWMAFLLLGSGNSSVTEDHDDALKPLTCTAADSSSSENNDASAVKHRSTVRLLLLLLLPGALEMHFGKRQHKH